MGVNSDPVTLHKYLYANVDPVNFVDPSGNFGLGSFSAASRVNGILNAVSIGQTAFDVFSAATDEDGITAKEVGFLVLASVGGAVGGKLLKMFSRKCKPGNSFDGDTLVATENGLRPISKIEIGEKVWAYNEETGEKSLQEVVHLILGDGSKELVDIGLDNGEVITATAEHPFYAGSAWVNARDLHSDSKLLSLGDESINVVATKSYSQAYNVYNLTIANDHTYYVGNSEVLSHNASKCNFVSAKEFSTRISKQKQARHIKGTKEWERKRGSYFNSEADASALLSAVHSKKVIILGKKKNGDLLVEYKGVQGFNNNPGAGFVDQPTSRFFIKKGDPTSVVPTSPLKEADELFE